ncbi:MAG: PAS and helix-turn-helix domain-containing protein [Rhodobacterales bacterium]|nr:PAS and helix-turn-helix domain-containing protein [Rhodobacterales bacterium]
MNHETELSLLTFQNAPIGLVMTENRIIRACNATFSKLFGYADQALIGQSFRMLYVTRAEFDRIRDVGLEPLKQADDYSDERIMRKSDGSPFWCRFRAHTLTPADPLARIVMSFAPMSVTTSKRALTPREREIITFLARGLTSKEIARSLFLSPRTIEDIRARLLRKFEVSNTAQLLGKFGDPGL